MKIQQLDLTVRDLVDGYHDDGDDGAVGYGGGFAVLKSQFAKRPEII